MNIFKFNENVKTYWIPILKIVLSIAVIILCINRGRFLKIDGFWWNVIDKIVALLVVTLAVLCIYLSFAEMLNLHEHRSESNVNLDIAKKHGKSYSMNEIETLVLKNDIIDIKVVFQNQIIKIGASSDNSPGSSQFFDKIFYINDKEYREFDEFSSKLQEFSNAGAFFVISIDDLPPEPA